MVLGGLIQIVRGLGLYILQNLLLLTDFMFRDPPKLEE